MKKILAATVPILAAATLLTAAQPRDEADAAALATLRQSNERLVRFVLDNGLVCLVKEDHSAPVVSIQIWVGTGSIHEGDLLGAGLSHFVEHMIFKGTPTRQPGDIARVIQNAGGQINAYTSLDRTVFHTDLPSSGWRVGLDALSDALMNASFPQEECDKEKNVILREISMGKDNADRQVNELLWRTAYSAHPYRLPVIGYKAIFESVTRDQLVSYFRRRYVPDNTVVAVVGDVPAAELEKAIRERFAAFTRRPLPAALIPEEPAQRSPRFQRETGAVQVSRLHLAFHTVSVSDSDAPALDVLAMITGSGQSSRLVKTIKEEKRLVHSIDAGSFTPRYPGLFIVSAQCDPDKEQQAVDAILSEIRSWSENAFSDAEVEKARRQVLVGELGALQTMHGQASSYASGELFQNDARYAEVYIDLLRQVTPDSLRVVARRYLRDENRTLVVLSPAAKKPEQAPAADKASAMDITRESTAAGVPLILRRDSRFPFIFVCAAFRGGVLSETATNAGITHLAADLLLKGTARRSSARIAETVESLGASLSAFAGYNSFGLTLSGLAGDADTLLELLFDCLGNAAFPEEEIAKQKTVQIAAIDEQRERPFFVAQEALDAAIFAGHPYQWTPLGRRDTVEHVDRAALLDFTRKALVTGNMALAIFGDIDRDKAAKLAEKHLKRVRPGPAPVVAQVRPAPQLPIRAENREPKEQCIILFGFPGVDMADPRKDALEVLDTAMSGMSSGLFKTIREDRGLAYYAGASQRPGVGTGIFMLYAGTRPDAMAEVERLMTEEMLRVSKDGLTQEELDRARNQIIAGHEMRLQDNAGLAMTAALNELYGLGYDYDTKTRQRIEAITAEKVRAAAASILATNRMAVSIVLPKSKAK